MDFVGIVGNRGSGKTNILTAYLKDYADDGVPVIANFKLNFPSISMSFEDLRKIVAGDPERIRGTVIGLDELGRGADSYEFFKKDVKDITFLIQQIRKLHSKVFYTVQRFGTIAKRLRDQTDGFIMMNDPDADNFTRPDGTLAQNHREVCTGIFRASYMNDDLHLIRSRLFDGRPYWNMYDTDEIIWR